MKLEGSKLMKARLERFYILVVILFFVLAGCTFQEAPMEYGIVVQLDREWWPKNLLEYPFTHWTYMFKPDGKKVIPPVRLGVSQYFLYTFSPDGKWLAYLNYDDNQVYVMRISDGKKVRVSSGLGEGNVSAIKWLSSSHMVAYGGDKVYIQDISCLSTEKPSSTCLPYPTIVKLDVNTSFFDISPDGRRIIYTYAEYEEGHRPVKFDIFLMEVDSLYSISLKDEGTNIRFIDNATLLVYSDNHVYVAKIDGNKVISKKMIAELKKGETSFMLSPDRKYMAFISSQREEGLGEVMDPYPSWDWVPTTSALFIMELATGKVRRLTYPNDHAVIWYDWYPLR